MVFQVEVASGQGPVTQSVITRHGTKLDRHLILEEPTPLAGLKDEPEILDRLNALFNTLQD